MDDSCEALKEALRKSLDQSGYLLLAGNAFSIGGLFAALNLWVGEDPNQLPVDLSWIQFSLPPREAAKTYVLIASATGWGSHLLMRRAIRVMRRLEFDQKVPWPHIEAALDGSSIIKTNTFITQFMSTIALATLTISFVILKPTSFQELWVSIPVFLIFTFPYLAGFFAPGIAFFQRRPFWWTGSNAINLFADNFPKKHRWRMRDYLWQFFMRRLRRLGIFGNILDILRNGEDAIYDERNKPWWFEPNADLMIVSILELLQREYGPLSSIETNLKIRLIETLESALESFDKGMIPSSIFYMEEFLRDVKEMAEQKFFEVDLNEMLIAPAHSTIEKLQTAK